MKTIHKYQLDVVPLQMIHMPEAAGIVCVRTQRGYPVLYAVHGRENDVITPRFFSVFTTGEEFSGGCVHLGTVELAEWFIAHVFEVDKDFKIKLRFQEDYNTIRTELRVADLDDNYTD